MNNTNGLHPRSERMPEIGDEVDQKIIITIDGIPYYDFIDQERDLRYFFPVTDSTPPVVTGPPIIQPILTAKVIKERTWDGKTQLQINDILAPEIVSRDHETGKMTHVRRQESNTHVSVERITVTEMEPYFVTDIQIHVEKKK